MSLMANEEPGIIVLCMHKSTYLSVSSTTECKGGERFNDSIRQIFRDNLIHTFTELTSI